MINGKTDYNKIMNVISFMLIILFCVSTFWGYIKYDEYNNSAPFYVFVINNMIVLLLPGILLNYLYNQNTLLKSTYYNITDESFNNDSNYKIAHISDFHNTNSKRLKNKIVNKLKQENPNAILITGDLIDSRRTNVATSKEFIQKITGIAPIYYVLGNHESRKENVQEIVECFEKIGVKVLRNDKVKLKDKLELIGLDDPNFYVPLEEQGDISELVNKVEDKLKILVEENNNYKILITHRPELLEAYSRNKIDLVFTGHAHGGQIRIPFIGGIIAPGQGFFPKYTKGIYIKEKTKMILSRGIGNSGFPFRFNNRPEVIFVNIQNNKTT